MERDVLIPNFEFFGNMLRDKIISGEGMSLYDFEEMDLAGFMYDLGATMGAIRLHRFGKLSDDYVETAINAFNNKWQKVAEELVTR